MLHVIESVAKGSPQNAVIKEQVTEKDTKVMVGEPAVYPQKMIDAICRFLKTNRNVNAVYLRLMIKDSEQSYLIVVDFHGDKNEVFSGVANTGGPFSLQLPKVVY